MAGKPEVLARIMGSVAFICPGCKKITNYQKVNWRGPRMECKECKRKFEFGVGLSEHLVGYPPFNARFVEKVAGDWYNNRWNFVGGDLWIGEVTGVVEYFCPKCLERQKRAPTQPECWVKCQRCQAVFFVTLILWKLRKGAKKHIPDDWTMPGLTYEDTEWGVVTARDVRAYRQSVGAPSGAPRTGSSPFKPRD